MFAAEPGMNITFEFIFISIMRETSCQKLSQAARYNPLTLKPPHAAFLTDSEDIAFFLLSAASRKEKCMFQHLSKVIIRPARLSEPAAVSESEGPVPPGSAQGRLP